jgi:hypothetical protein
LIVDYSADYVNLVMNKCSAHFGQVRTNGN